jgi:hypothetical protein
LKKEVKYFLAVLITGSVILFAIVISLLLYFSGKSPFGTHAIDTVRYDYSNRVAVVIGDVPNIWIDTNVKLDGVFGGTIKSSLPYSIAVNYTDNSFSIATIIIDDVTIIYDSGEKEASTDFLSLPIPIPAKEGESLNSVSGGRVVKTTYRAFHGKVPNVITKAQSFDLLLKGRFIKEDGTETPFVIDHHYIYKNTTTTLTGMSALQGV